MGKWQLSTSQEERGENSKAKNTDTCLWKQGRVGMWGHSLIMSQRWDASKVVAATQKPMFNRPGTWSMYLRKSLSKMAKIKKEWWMQCFSTRGMVFVPSRGHWAKSEHFWFLQLVVGVPVSRSQRCCKTSYNARTAMLSPNTHTQRNILNPSVHSTKIEKLCLMQQI